MFKIISILFFLLKFSFSANILLYYSPFGKTHLLSFLPLLQQLGKDGHNVTVYHIDSTPPPPSLGKNISVINVEMSKDENNSAQFMEMFWSTTGHGILIPFIYYMGKEGFTEILLNSNDTYFKTLSDNYDLIIIDELFTLHGIAGADIVKQRKNIPYIIYSPTVQTFWYQSMIALSRNYVSSDCLFGPLPSKPTDYYKPSNFFDRIIAFFETSTEVILMNLFTLPITNLLLPGANMERFFTEAHLTLGEHIDRLGNPLSEGIDLLLVGSNCKSASKVINSTLPKEWEIFIEDPKSKGTIYVSFGSAILWDFAPERIRNSFIQAFNKMSEYRIIFSWNGKFPTEAKSHIKFSKWAPQMAILSHPKTKVFFTHGGLKSLKESLCAEVPVVLLPLLAEQSYNAKFGLKVGIGLVLNKYELNPEKIVETIKNVANNNKYRENIQKLKDIYLDRLIDASEYGSFRINKLLKERKKFGNELYDSAHENLIKRKGRLLSNWKFHGIDLIFAIFTLVNFLK